MDDEEEDDDEKLWLLDRFLGRASVSAYDGCGPDRTGSAQLPSRMRTAASTKRPKTQQRGGLVLSADPLGIGSHVCTAITIVALDSIPSAGRGPRNREFYMQILVGRSS